MPVKPCLDCGRLSRDTRCPDCTAAHNRQVNQRRTATRPSPAQRGYGWDWRRVRAEVLQRDNGICHWCGDQATTVDHLEPLAQGGDRLDPRNLAAACFKCNSRRGGQTRRPDLLQP